MRKDIDANAVYISRCYHAPNRLRNGFRHEHSRCEPNLLMPNHLLQRKEPAKVSHHLVVQHEAMLHFGCTTRGDAALAEAPLIGLDVKEAHNSLIQRPCHRLRSFGCRCGPFNWLGGTQPEAARLAHCKVRHGPESYRCSVRFEDGGAGGSGSGVGSAGYSCGVAGKRSSTCSGSGAADLLAVAGAAAGDTQRSHEVPTVDTHGATTGRSGGHDPIPAVRNSASSVAGAVSAVVVLDSQDQGVAPGQYAVFFDGDVCLGSAVIQEPLCLP